MRAPVVNPLTAELSLFQDPALVTGEWLVMQVTRPPTSTRGTDRFKTNNPISSKEQLHLGARGRLV